MTILVSSFIQPSPLYPPTAGVPASGIARHLSFGGPVEQSTIYSLYPKTRHSNESDLGPYP